jgi:hypothetical protein
MMYGTVLLRMSGVKSILILYGRVRFEVGLSKGDFSHFILEKKKTILILYRIRWIQVRITVKSRIRIRIRIKVKMWKP